MIYYPYFVSTVPC